MNLGIFISIVNDVTSEIDFFHNSLLLSSKL